MNKLTFDRKFYKSRLGAEHATHNFASLMSPLEVAKATLRQPLEVQQRLAGHWILSGDAASTMFHMLKVAPARQSSVRITGFTSPAGFAYFVLTHQVEHYQHRFLLALTDPAVQELLKSISSTGQIAFILGNADVGDALFLENPLMPTMFMPMLAMAQEVSLEAQRSALEELPCVQVVMGDPHQVPSMLDEYSVKHVSVSLLLPDVLKVWFKTSTEYAVGI